MQKPIVAQVQMNLVKEQNAKKRVNIRFAPLTKIGKRV